MIDLTYTVAALHEMPPLTWRWWTSGDEDGPGLIMFRDGCEDAIHHGTLNLQPNPWDIADDGTVTPSVHFLDCGWHEFVRLLDWTPESDDKASEERT